MNFSREFKNTAPRLLALLSGIVTTVLYVISYIHELQNFSQHKNHVGHATSFPHETSLIIGFCAVLPSCIAFLGWNRWPRLVHPRFFTLFVAIAITVGLTLVALDTNFFTGSENRFYGVFSLPTFILLGIISLALPIWYMVKAVQVYDLMSHGSVSTIKRFTDKDKRIQKT